jgi:hypothetical protein
MRRFDASASNDTLGEEVGRFVRKLDDLLTLSPPEDVNNPEFKKLVVELLPKPLASWLRQQAHAGTFTSYESDPLFKCHIGAGAGRLGRGSGQLPGAPASTDPARHARRARQGLRVAEVDDGQGADGGA